MWFKPSGLKQHGTASVTSRPATLPNIVVWTEISGFTISIDLKTTQASPT
jgi:hypothetical protein